MRGPPRMDRPPMGPFCTLGQQQLQQHGGSMLGSTARGRSPVGNSTVVVRHTCGMAGATSGGRPGCARCVHGSECVLGVPVAVGCVVRVGRGCSSGWVEALTRGHA
jgi:hypothetical protein